MASNVICIIILNTKQSTEYYSEEISRENVFHNSAKLVSDDEESSSALSENNFPWIYLIQEKFRVVFSLGLY